MKKHKALFWIVLILAIAINIFILVNAFIVGEKSAAESNKIAHATADVINTVKPETITSQNFPKFAYYVRKSIGHFGLFCVSGLFSTWSIYLMFSNSENCKFLWSSYVSISHGLLLAILSEFIQIFVSGRSGNFVDVGIDFTGYVLGCLFLLIIALIVNKKSQNKIRN